MLNTLDKLENILQGLKFEKSRSHYRDNKLFSYERSGLTTLREKNRICFYKISYESHIGPMSYFKFCVYADGRLAVRNPLQSERTITGIDIFDVPSIILLYGND